MSPGPQGRAEGGERCPAVCLRGLTYSYPTGGVALRDVSLEVAAGERLALVGPNGAGKSTLLLHLNGILAGSGAVVIGGLELGPRTRREVRARIGLVFQDPDDQLFSLSVLEDVAFGPLQQGLTVDEARRRAEAALDAVGMLDRAQRVPQQLSLGERKRVAIATVLSMRPQVLVLDEPSAGLDPRARRSLVRLLAGMSETMLIATHDMRLVWELCPRTVIMDEGAVVADGPTSVLMRDDCLLERHGLEAPWWSGEPVVCEAAARPGAPL
ncbi:MAG: energy-coupling factor ABC transporter ATP-binding protein [Anaerolineae bacterium]